MRSPLKSMELPSTGFQYVLAEAQILVFLQFYSIHSPELRKLSNWIKVAPPQKSKIVGCCAGNSTKTRINLFF